MNTPLMPKATAVWLVENTSLTFEQIANFCGMHALEVQGIADGEVAVGIIGLDPVIAGQLTREEITRCEESATLQLRLTDKANVYAKEHRNKKKGTKYTPVARRQDRPDAIAWLLKNCSHISDAEIIRLIGTTRNTIHAIRDRSHWNYTNLRPRDPELLGLCSQSELDKVMEKNRLLEQRLEKERQASSQEQSS